MKRRILGFLLSICLVISLFPSMYTEAATTTCTIYNGTNVEWQNYSKWASPTTSYLSECADGTIMRVQYGSSIEGILVEYYNTSYDFISSKIIPEELPIFGAFYETDTNYFLLTGQTNEQESAEVEVYRITKYDKQWKRIGSTGLYDCNTTIPFYAGSARMDDWGKYLLIRTCHEMYRTSDGYNHQANVTIQLDMETMQITDSFTDIMNTSCGYVSHSFNQFIKIEDGKIVAVDHGDAHLRGVTLIRYKTDLSTGKFVPIWESFCEVTNAMKFPGEIGENVTGAAIGGFELSDSRYLITGHSVEQDSNNLTRKTRNVFVIAVDKNKLESKINWLTSYEEGDGTTSTPQMVKINDNRFLVLWSRDNTVYYTEVDGIGKQIGTTYSISGSLSDCVPIVVGNKIIWYTWKNETVIFYEISINNLEQAQSTTIENGHQYESQGVVDGHVILYCPICGTTYEMPIATSISIGWNTNGGGVYSSIISTRREVGDRLYYWIEPEPLNANKEMEVVISDPEIISWTPSSEVKGVLTMLKPGTATVIFRPKFNPDVGRTYTITVKGDIPITSIALNKTELELEEGTSEKLSVSYTPSDTTDEKKVTWKSDNEGVAKVASDGTVTAVKAGTATITATASNGKSASCTVTVKAAPVVVDKTKLQEAIKKYDAYKESDYASGWSEFEKALADAKTINEKADATQAEVDSARKKLEEAAGNLVEKKPISSIALNKTKLELEEGNSEKLTVSYTPSDTTDEKKVTWKSDNEGVAKVASDGTVTAVKAGTATITATASNGKSASCTVTVKAAPVVVDKTKLQEAIKKYDAYKESDYASGWSEFEKALADAKTINEKADATQAEVDSARKKLEEAAGNLVEKKPISSIALNKTKLELEEGNSEKLTVSYTPSDTTDEKKVTWKSDNEGVAKVASDGTVTAVKAGTATITATASNGKSASCTVTVKAAPVVVDKTKLQEAIKKYDAYKESDYASGWSEFEKALADAKTINEKADATQAEVDSARKKLEEAAGNLVEKKPISSIALNKTKLELEEGASEKLSVSYMPSDTTDEKKVTWKSDNEGVAKVASDGTVTAVKAGTATITATASNGKSASCTVTVKAAPVVVDKTKLQEAIKKYDAYKESDYASGWSEFEKALADAKTINEKADATQAEVDNARKKLEEAAGNLVEKKPISSIALNKTKLELEEGNSEKLTVSYTPSDTTDEKKVTWKSDNEGVAKVASDGTVTAVKAGTATITATTANGKTASCVITVMPEPEKPIQIYYRTHVQNLGWQSYVTDGVMSGTTGKSLRLEGIEIYLENNKIGGSIEYRTHVQNLGWQPYVTDGAMSGTKGKSLRLEAIQIRLTGELAQKYDVYYRTHIQDLGWLGWAVNDGKSGSAGLSKRLEGIQIRLVEKGESAPGTTENAYMTNEKTYHPSVSYSTHVQNLGWQSEVKDGVMSGTKGKSLRLEGIKIRVNGDGLSGGIEYSTHVQNLGWQPYVCNGEMAGTKGKSLRLEGIKIRLTGELAKKYSVEYRTHVQNLGWQDWVRDDSLSGTKGKGLRLEGIEIRIVKK